MKYLIRVALAVAILAATTIYGAATLSFIEYGAWPTYGRPESWSSYPLNTGLGHLVFDLVLVFVGFERLALWTGGIGGIGLAWGVIARRLGQAVRFSEAAALVGISGFMIWDPFGTLNWFLD